MIPSAPTIGSTHEIGRHALHAALDDLDREPNADHAGGARRAPCLAYEPTSVGGRGRHAPRVLEAAARRWRRCCTLLLAKIARRRAALDRLAPEEDGRAGKLVAREHRRRRGVDVAHEQREILRGGLEPDVAARAAEPTWKDGAVVERHSASGRVRVDAGAGSYRRARSGRYRSRPTVANCGVRARKRGTLGCTTGLRINGGPEAADPARRFGRRDLSAGPSKILGSWMERSGAPYALDPEAARSCVLRVIVRADPTLRTSMTTREPTRPRPSALCRRARSCLARRPWCR